MKKFEFSLDRMRHYKDQVLDEQVGILGRMRLRMHRIEENIARQEQDFYNISADMLRDQAEGITIQELRSYEYKRTNIRRILEQLRRDLRVAQNEVERQTAVVVAASQEVSKLVKLEDRQLEEYRAYVARTEENEMEEFINSRRYGDEQLSR